MNDFIKLGLGLVAFGFGWEIAKKPKTEKPLTIDSNFDNVETPIANNVPNQNESEPESSSHDDSGKPDSGESV